MLADAVPDQRFVYQQIALDRASSFYLSLVFKLHICTLIWNSHVKHCYIAVVLMQHSSTTSLHFVHPVPAQSQLYSVRVSQQRPMLPYGLIDPLHEISEAV